METFIDKIKDVYYDIIETIKATITLYPITIPLTALMLYGLVLGDLLIIGLTIIIMLLVPARKVNT